MAPARKRKKTAPKPKVTSSDCSALEKHSQLVASSVQKVRKHEKKKLRQQLRQLRKELEYSRKARKDALQLFPQEIWELILKSVEDVNDLASCARTCILFQSVINSTQEAYFGNVLPHLIPYLQEDRAKQVVKLGRVCKSWRAAVNSFAKANFQATEVTSHELEKVLKEHKPRNGFDGNKILCARTLKLSPKLKYNPGSEICLNPFMSDVIISPSSDTKILTTAESYGHLMWQLTLELGFRQDYTSQQFYKLCVTALENCKNLRSFRLQDYDDYKAGIRFEMNGIDEKLEISSAETLESLAVLVENQGILPIQDKLIQSLSAQLKRVELRHWNTGTYHALPWQNLIHLEILEGTTVEVFQSLQNITATKLYKLSVRLDSSCSLVDLFKIINHFSGLRHLEILLTEGFAVDIPTVPLQMLSANHISILKITSETLKTCQDLPIMFPYLRVLTYRHGYRSAKMHGLFREKNNKTTRKAKHYGHFIQIYNNMYKSNIWTVLPRLETLALEYKSVGEFRAGVCGYVKSDKSSQTFTRQRYMWETENYSVAFQRHAEKIRDVVRAKELQRVKEERKALNKTAKENKIQTRRYPKGKKRNEEMDKSAIDIADLRNMAFPFILAQLTHSEVLVCRFVCKDWLRLVGDQHCVYNTTLICNAPMNKTQHKRFYALTEESRDNPLFGRKVEIRLGKGSGRVDGTNVILNRIGKCIEFLTVSNEQDVSPEIAEVYQICASSFKKCPNMREFSLHLPYIRNMAIGKNCMREYAAAKQSETLSRPKNLKSLSICGPDIDRVSIFSNRDSALNTIIQDLLHAFGSTLVSLKQDRSTEKVFLQIKELAIRHFCNDTKNGIKKRWPWDETPNLEKLHVCVTGQEISLKDLNRLGRFGTDLSFLELQFSSECGGFETSTISGNPTHIIGVTVLHLVFKNKYQVSLDFLVHFPFLKTLRISYGEHTRLLNEEVKNDDDDKHAVEQPLLRRTPETDFIQLVKYFQDKDMPDHNAKEIYSSNIWVVVSRLSRLEVVYWKEEDVNNVTVFHRRN